MRSFSDTEIPMRGLQCPWFLSGPGELRGRPLRHLLTTLLSEAGTPLTVRELVARCQAEGVVFDGRASKIVSDALRWEIGWGRVTRLSRGVYRYARMPRSTKWWIARRVNDIRAYLARIRTGQPRPDLSLVVPIAARPGFVT